MKNLRKIKLTRTVLQLLNFHGEGYDHVKRPCYRYDLGHGHRYLQVVLNDYPETNPNCGIVSIFFPEMKQQHMFTQEKKTGQSKKEVKKIDFVTEEDSEYFYGIKYLDVPSHTTPIAWHVTTVGRICDIYRALTMKSLNLKRLREELNRSKNG